ncbi:hypothetical protein DK847_03185 [Aestuariivirga litoralis]|uniref:Uncharacterized protein n=1 Tax=Aestuariivirga litoralis TaxID=2650924 RepID=A0A2W2BEX6_9HYPH|nr:hypothetical protein [Aestuariivirga litoralis]PZF78814.1 hypothetical protein DK847_03185 [Aestuariivirga litoralis]
MADPRRSLRLLFKFGLLVTLPLTGYLWAQTGVSPLTIGMSVACVVMALGAEGLASVAESRLSQLRAQAEAEELTYRSEATVQDERIRQMDRIVETMSNQNHDLRGKLVALHGELHRLDEELALLPADAPADPQGGDEPEGGGGDVTDISTLRNRR